jgi:hypothetical protein
MIDQFFDRFCDRERAMNLAGLSKSPPRVSQHMATTKDPARNISSEIKPEISVFVY